MAYPMAPALSTAELIRRLAKYKVTRRRSTTVLQSPKGNCEVHYLERKFPDGRRIGAMLPKMNRGELIEPLVYRTVLVRLEIDPADFGLGLEDLRDHDC